MTQKLYAYWRTELKSPGQSRDTADGDTDGFWRAKAAKTKPDYPVAIWHDGDDEVIKIGNKQIAGNMPEGNDFRDGTWQHCIAVTKEQYDAAIETGFWADGKNSRKMSAEEKMGIDIAPGDNAAPIDETISDQISAAVAKADAIKSVKTEAEAKAANELADKLNTLFKLGDAERAKEKAPFDQGAKDVQARWLPIINPASEARERLVGRGGLVKQWLKAEQDRIDREDAEERRRQQEEADRIRRENEKAAAEAAEQGKPEPEPIAPPDPVPAVEPQRARAGNTFGRATGLRKVVSAQIDDIEKVLLALKTHKEMIAMVQTLANRAAKAGIALDGMTIREDYE